jgi:hypothetical protein
VKTVKIIYQITNNLWFFFPNVGQVLKIAPNTYWVSELIVMVIKKIQIPNSDIESWISKYEIPGSHISMVLKWVFKKNSQITTQNYQFFAGPFLK